MSNESAAAVRKVCALEAYASESDAAGGSGIAAEVLPDTSTTSELTPEELKIIDEEETRLGQITALLYGQISRNSKRLRVENERSRALTAELVSTRRAEDKQLLASDEAVSYKLRDKSKDDIEVLEKLCKSPYFGRLVVEEVDNQGRKKEIAYYIGKHANSDCRIVDWRRSPLAKLFYEYQEGDEYEEEILGRLRFGTVLYKSKVHIADGELLGIATAVGNFERCSDQETKGGATSSHNIKPLNASKAGVASRQWQRAQKGSGFLTRRSTRRGLPDVLSLITPDQYRALTDDKGSALFVQGVAGSGKTTVAIQRMNWLLNRTESPLSASKVAFVVKSDSLRDYISLSLVNAGMKDVSVFTLRSFLESQLARVIGRQYLVENLAGGRAGNSVRRPVTSGQMMFSAERLKRSMGMLKSIRWYVDTQRERLTGLIKQRLLPILHDTERAQIRAALEKVRAESKFVCPHEELAVTLEYLKKFRDAVKGGQSAGRQVALDGAITEFSSVLKRLDLVDKDLIEILKVPRILLENDETHFLDRETVEQVLKTQLVCAAQSEIDLLDDCLLLLLSNLKNGKRSPLQRFDHLVIDEVQDFAAPELAVVVQAVKHPGCLTIVGDLDQVSSPHVRFDTAELIKNWSWQPEETGVVSLAVSHRSTLPIIKLASYIQANGKKAEGRDGELPIWYRCRSETLAVSELARCASSYFDDEAGLLLAVLCANSKEAREVYSYLKPQFSQGVFLGEETGYAIEEGILVADIRQVKGLEFPHVLIWNPSDTGYPADAIGRNLLYIAVTRAEEALTIITWSRPSPHLPPSSRKLLRVSDVEENDSEDGDD